MELRGKSLLVFGSRSLNDERVEAEIEKAVAAGGYDIIITALDPMGVCAQARHYAKASRRGLTLLQVGLDASHARGMWNKRSLKAIRMADHMLAIWGWREQRDQRRDRAGENKTAPDDDHPDEAATSITDRHAWREVPIKPVRGLASKGHRGLICNQWSDRT